MNFSEQLNEVIDLLESNSKELSQETGLSSAVISRYRNGKRVPNVKSDQMKKLVDGIYRIGKKKRIDLTKDEIFASLSCSLNEVAIDPEQVSRNFSELVNALNISIASLSRAIRYDPSLLSKIRLNKRTPSNTREFINLICNYITEKYTSDNNKSILAELINCKHECLDDKTQYFDKLYHWFSTNKEKKDVQINRFLNNLDNFDLNEYITLLNFDKIKIPYFPFYKKMSQTYYGITEMKQGELDFFKTIILSKTKEPVFMASNMPMEDMAKDIEFGKKWMYAIALTIKKGLHINIVHDLNRPFNEMMLGLESWIPIYMTGHISPYYFPIDENTLYQNLNYVSEVCALTGESIIGYHNDGKYYLTTKKNEIDYYNRKAKHLLKKAKPLMNIYTKEEENTFLKFLMNNAKESGNRKRIISSLPICTIRDDLLLKILKRNDVSNNDAKKIVEEVKKIKMAFNEILTNNTIIDEITNISKDEFAKDPPKLSLSKIFYERDIYYNYDEYLNHFRDTEMYSKNNRNYKLSIKNSTTFKNIDIIINSKKYVIVSKSNNPSIHFVIFHPQLCNSIENFVAPIKEKV